MSHRGLGSQGERGFYGQKVFKVLMFITLFAGDLGDLKFHFSLIKHLKSDISSLKVRNIGTKLAKFLMLKVFTCTCISLLKCFAGPK